MPKFIDRTGQRFGRLTVLALLTRASRRTACPTKWTCRCDCGNMVDVAASKLPNGHTRSCGCLQREQASAASLRHGQSTHPNGGNATKEYNTWSMMIRRCTKTSSVDYSEYGGRGIFVCERWMSFGNFFEDMGRAPTKNHSIDRQDNDGPYSLENCKWSTPKEQRRNQRRVFLIEHDGKKLTPKEWEEITGISNKRIHARIKILGWSVEKTLTTPIR